MRGEEHAMNAVTYVVEHPTRGILVDQERDPYAILSAHAKETGYTTRWSHSRPRTEARQFADLEQAQTVISRIPLRTRSETVILEFGSWKPVGP
jgi:hypothetical protein